MRNIGIEYPEAGKAAFYELGDPPEPGPTEILIGTRYSGITNGTERHALMGEHGWTKFPGRHGYQHVGVVERVGEKVEGFGTGDWVFYGQYVGHRGWHVQDMSSLDASLTVRLPGSVDRKKCALLGVAGVSMRGARRCRVSPAQNVWVAGQGLIGQFAAQAARALGARVTVSDVNKKRLDIAGKLGAHSVINACSNTAWEELKQQSPFDCIIDACGVESLFLDIHKHKLQARRGVICALAVRDESVFNWHMLHGRESSIEVSCHFSVDDLRVVLHFLEQGIIRIDPVVSHETTIDKAPGVYKALRDRPQDLLGVIFDWE